MLLLPLSLVTSLVGAAAAADVDTFEPTSAALDAGPGLQLIDPHVGLPGGWYAGLVTAWAHDPVVSVLPEGEELPVVTSQFATRLAGGGTFGGPRGQSVRVDADLPFYPWVGLDEGGTSGFATGDLRVRATMSAWKHDALGLAVGVSPALRLPTGRTSAYAGAGGIGGGLGGSVAWTPRQLAALRLTGNLGLEGLPAGRLGDVDFGSGLSAGAGASWKAWKDLSAGLELDHRATLVGSEGGASRYPTELHLFAGWNPDGAEAPGDASALAQVRRHLTGTFGVGTSLVGGLGSPDLRVVAALGWRAAGKVRAVDEDGDGIADVDDACPLLPEDDAKRTPDGCPDTDSDGDGIRGPADQCLDKPEDFDKNLDTDGCPDETDDDGVYDPADKCPALAGPAENTGCPIGTSPTATPASPPVPATPAAPATPPVPSTAPVLATPPAPAAPTNPPAPATPAVRAAPPVVVTAPVLVTPPAPADSDKDTVPDAKDACPKVAGDPTHAGCGDSDGDAIFDDVDACLDQKPVAGSDLAYADGCARQAWVQNGAIFLGPPPSFDGVALARSAEPALNDLARLLGRFPAITLVTVTVHIDKQATPEAALDLTRKRAAALVAYLTGPGKIAPARLVAVGAGDALPVDSNMTDAGRANNRRVEITFAATPSATPAPTAPVATP